MWKRLVASAPYPKVVFDKRFVSDYNPSILQISLSKTFASERQYSIHNAERLPARSVWMEIRRR
jgi:hypothetical protein